MEEKKHRLNLEVTARFDKGLATIMKKGEVLTKTQAVLSAVKLLALVIEAQDQGKELAFVNAKGEIEKIHVLL